MYPPLDKKEKDEVLSIRKKFIKDTLSEVSEAIDASIENPKVSLILLHNKLEDIAEFIPPDVYMKYKLQLHKMTHGEKIQIDQRVINLTAVLTDEERHELLKHVTDKNKR